LSKIDLRENKQKCQHQSIFKSIQHALGLEVKIKKERKQLNAETINNKNFRSKLEQLIGWW
jgi:hypothetical protein